MKKILLLIYLLSIVFILNAQKKYSEVEKLTYSGYYNWGFVWMRAGVVEFYVEESEKYSGATKIEAIGYSLPSWDWVFKLRDTLISHFNSDDFLPYESSRKAHEGKYHKTFDYIWDYAGEKVYADIERIGKYQRRDTIVLKPDTYDMLSIAWKVRDLDYDNYQKNDTIPIKLLVDNEIHDLYIRYHGVETVKVSRKKTACYVFSPLLVEGDVFTKGENMKIWLSKDEHRIPIMVEAKILVGSVKGIIDYSGSKYGLK